MCLRRLACAPIVLLFVLLAFAAPAAGQGGEPSPSDAAARREMDSGDSQRLALLPHPCLACEAARRDVGRARAAEALPRGVAPLIGGVGGAVVGFVAMRVACANRSCEMADLVGIVGGAVIGATIGRAVEGTLPGQPRR